MAKDILNAKDYLEIEKTCEEKSFKQELEEFQKELMHQKFIHYLIGLFIGYTIGWISGFATIHWYNIFFGYIGFISGYILFKITKW